MTSTKTALLFVGNPSLAVEHFVESLHQRLVPLGMQAEEISPLPGALVSFRTGSETVSVCISPTPMPADNFKGALASPLSRPAAGILGETLARHTRHMIVNVTSADDTNPTGTALLAQLQLAHATTSLLVEWHMPAAVYWQQSNQLLTGAQYLQLVTDPAPWALFAQAKISYSGEPDQMVPLHSLLLEEAVEFVGRPIQVANTDLPLDEMHAAALSFLRHGVETGTPIADGHTFGPDGGNVFQVAHIGPDEALQNGMFSLSVVETDAGMALGDPARSPGAARLNLGLPHAASSGLAENEPADTLARTRSMAISFLMLVIMPPVGAILLMANAVFGSNVWRTGLIALASVALAVAVGAYTFMNTGQQTSLLFESTLIQSSILSE